MALYTAPKSSNEPVSDVFTAKVGLCVLISVLKYDSSLCRPNGTYLAVPLFSGGLHLSFTESDDVDELFRDSGPQSCLP